MMIRPKLDWKSFDYTKPVTDPLEFCMGENNYLVLIEDMGYPKGNTTNEPEYYISTASPYGSYLDNFWDTDSDWDEGQELHVVAYCELGIPIKVEDNKRKKRKKKSVDNCDSWKAPSGGFRSLEERDMFYK